MKAPFLTNTSDHAVELPSGESIRTIAHLKWRLTDETNQETYALWSGFFIGGSGHTFSQRDFVVLKPGERMELQDVAIPYALNDTMMHGAYRISMRYGFPPPGVKLPADDFLRSKPWLDLSSNELKVIVPR